MYWSIWSTLPPGFGVLKANNRASRSRSRALRRAWLAAWRSEYELATTIKVSKPQTAARGHDHSNRSKAGCREAIIRTMTMSGYLTLQPTVRVMADSSLIRVTSSQASHFLESRGCGQLFGVDDDSCRQWRHSSRLRATKKVR